MRVALILSLVLLAGCGFQLRGQHVLPAEFKRMTLHSDAPYDRFSKTLRNELILLGNQCDPRDRNQLIIHQHNYTVRETTIDTSNEVRVYAYDYFVHFSLRINCKLLIDNKLITTSRILNLAPDAQLYTNNQQDLVLYELEREAIAQLLNQLHARACR